MPFTRQNSRLSIFFVLISIILIAANPILNTFAHGTTHDDAPSIKRTIPSEPQKVVASVDQEPRIEISPYPRIEISPYNVDESIISYDKDSEAKLVSEEPVSADSTKISKLQNGFASTDSNSFKTVKKLPINFNNPTVSPNTPQNPQPEGPPTILQREGRWTDPVSSTVVGIQASTLPNGKILLYDGTEGQGNGDERSLIYEVYDTEQKKSERFTAKNAMGELIKYAAFCAAMVVLPSGGIFFAGGDVNGDAIGSKKSAIFNAVSNTWNILQQMTFARWYPSAIETLKGDILVVGGTEDSYSNPASIPEIYEFATNTWKVLTGANDTNDPAYGGSGHFYPWLFNLSNGKVANLGPRPTISLIGTENVGSLQNYAPRDLYDTDSEFTARMQTYGSVARFSANNVLVTGGGINPDDHNSGEIAEDSPDIFGPKPVETANIVTLSELTKAAPGQPQGDLLFTQETGRPKVPRANGTLVILPDGKVMLTGGSSLNEGADRNAQYDNAVLTPEIWDKNTGVWTNLASHKTRRIYHSIALLQKDGTVLQGGGSGYNGQCTNPRGGNQITVKGTAACRQLDIYEPGYLFDKNGAYKTRPNITSAKPQNLSIGNSFIVSSNSNISKVTFVKPGNTTHSTNIQQYFMETSVQTNGSQANVTIPNNHFEAPKGVYFMFIWDQNGTPSIAQEIEIK